MVPVEQFTPAAVAEFAGSFRGTDDVGEENRGEHSIGLGRLANSCEELLDLRNDLVAAVDPESVVDSGQFDVAGIAERSSKPAAVLDVANTVIGAVEHERGHADRLDHLADVDLVS